MRVLRWRRARFPLASQECGLDRPSLIESPGGRPRIRCLIADAHALVRHGMRRLLEDEPDIQVVEEAGTADETLQKLADCQPDVALVDTGMAGFTAQELLRLVQHTSPRTRLIFLTGHDDNQSALHGLQAGAMGYVHKDTGAANLVQALRDVARGLRYVSPQVLHRVRKDVPSQAEVRDASLSTVSLTRREQEIIKLLAEGNSVKQAAEVLGVSAKTVEAHKFNLMRKLGIHNKAQLVTFAIRSKIVKLPTGT
jgi:DNA-binding NarL/FixJ family response regulator